MRILITGGAGFIGSHLAEAHLEQGDEVYVIDDLSTGSLKNIEIFLKNEHFFFSRDTILNHDKMLELIGTCDRVYHLAAAVGVLYVLRNPFQSIRINIQGTEKVLELCNKFKKRVLITSSSEVYGKHTHAPLTESDDIIYGPSSKFRWSYAASKLMDEFMGLAYHRTNGLEVVITRLFNTVGPKQTGAYGMVIPRFVGQALRGQALTVYGNGKQSRTFTYVKDVVTALMGLMNSPEATGELFNVGGTEEISIEALAQRVVAMTNSGSQLEYIPYEVAFDKDFEDMHRRVPDIKKINRCIGFEPKTDLDSIIKSVIAYISSETASSG